MLDVVDIKIYEKFGFIMYNFEIYCFESILGIMLIEYERVIMVIFKIFLRCVNSGYKMYVNK